MQTGVPHLLKYELDALLEAVRRDMREQTRLAFNEPFWRDWHTENARINKRILEALNPKASKNVFVAPRSNCEAYPASHTNQSNPSDDRLSSLQEDTLTSLTIL